MIKSFLPVLPTIHLQRRTTFKKFILLLFLRQLPLNLSYGKVFTEVNVTRVRVFPTWTYRFYCKNLRSSYILMVQNYPWDSPVLQLVRIYFMFYCNYGYTKLIFKCKTVLSASVIVYGEMYNTILQDKTATTKQVICWTTPYVFLKIYGGPNQFYEQDIKVYNWGERYPSWNWSRISRNSGTYASSERLSRG